VIFSLLGLVAIWFGSGYLGVTPKRRNVAVFVFLGLGFLPHLLLSNDAALRVAFGGEWGRWALVSMTVSAVLLFQKWLGWLRQKANALDDNRAGPLAKTPLFSDAELERYARHIVLREIGGLGQKRLKEAKVLVVGAGGLGAPALQYLAAAGVGFIGVIDDDLVDNSNLQRQVIHRDGSIDLPKVVSAAQEMRAQNPYVTVLPIHRRLTRELALEILGDYDLILDGTDNFSTRYMVNEIAARLQVPLISAALTQWEGQISTYDPARLGPCYQCVFPEAPAAGLAPSCAEAGVVGPLPGVIGSMMALEVVKELTLAGEGLRGRLVIYDGLFAETRIIKLKSRENCPICGGKAETETGGALVG
jgi:molybdopterin/thiamine biosynthesis adenylyltransferase